MSNYYRKRAQQGFSLVELMIAMLLGLLLLVGVVNLFLGSSQTYRLQEALFRVQESGRFALDIMQRDLLNAGFQNVIPIGANRDTSIVAVTGHPNSTPLPSAVINNGVASDILHLNMNEFRDGAGTLVGDIYYYLAPDVSGQNSLYRNTDAVVEGVEAIEFLYGVDTDGDRDPDIFNTRTAVGAGQWEDVIAVRVSILVAAGDAGIVETAQTPSAPFAAVNTSDRRMYQVFSNTIVLRNKMP